MEHGGTPQVEQSPETCQVAGAEEVESAWVEADACQGEVEAD